VEYVSSLLPTFRDDLAFTLSNVKKSKKTALYFLKMEPIGCPEISVTNC